jgi:hypothetical protein
MFAASTGSGTPARMKPHPASSHAFLGSVERLRVLLLDLVIGTHVDDNAGAVGHPGEQARCVAPGPAGVITPAQPERLRRDHGDLRVEVSGIT